MRSSATANGDRQLNVATGAGQAGNAAALMLARASVLLTGYG